jgi:prepilin-type N-terminal cleavage/methylation domain-containing protein
MKNQSRRRSHGFTLVELLVVIAIIAVLASAGFAAGNAAIQKARKTTALSTATAIESAVNNFYTEYGSMPVDGSSDTTVQTDSGSGVAMLRVLLGVEGTSGNVLNTRGIRFLSVREGKANRNGLIYQGTGSDVRGLYDPWGGPYHVRLDLDYDEKITVQPSAGASTTLNGRRVAAWSNGADGVKGGGKAADDVRTWGN